MNPRFTLKTTPHFNGRIDQQLLYEDVVNPEHMILEWVMDTREEQIREALIALGWTPPKLDSVRP